MSLLFDLAVVVLAPAIFYLGLTSYKPGQLRLGWVRVILCIMAVCGVAAMSIQIAVFAGLRPRFTFEWLARIILLAEFAPLAIGMMVDTSRRRRG